jgi:sulfatase maturation enzyme AslB (radical SAM superfamily)
MSDVYCSIIHGGLALTIKTMNAIVAQSCCLRDKTTRFKIDPTTNFWNDSKFISLRDINKQNIWAPGCENCERLESAGQASLRVSVNNTFWGDLSNLAGPKKIDLQFDIGCNLACRTCGPHSSTFWQKHLKEHGEYNKPIVLPQQHATVIKALEKLDLSNLQMLVFAGGETLLGQAYWEVANWLADNVPDAKQQLTLCFQTNGTQPIHPRNYKIIERFNLVKLHISLDGIQEKFEYLRWPASWSQVTDNLMQIRAAAPSNVMFHIEETVSIFNLFYHDELEKWMRANFTINREGDAINHTKHLAHGPFALQNCTQEYIDAIQAIDYKNLIPNNWEENPIGIRHMIEEIAKFDHFRNQSFQHTFPEVAEFYSRYL